MVHDDSFVLKERIRIDINSFPVALWIADYHYREVQVVVTWTSVTCVADEADNVTLAHKLSFIQSFGIALKMCVIEDELLVGA